MHDILFYIFAAIILTSILFIAFTLNIKSSIKGFAYFIAGFSGVLLLLNSQLLSLIIVLVLLTVMFAGVLCKEVIYKFITEKPVRDEREDTYFTELNSETSQKNEQGKPVKNANIISLLVISLLSAIMASVLGAARWQMISIEYSVNSFGMIFTKYLPFILAISLLLSAMIPVIFRIVKLKVPSGSEIKS